MMQTTAADLSPRHFAWLVDGKVAAVAERRQVYRVLTTDQLDFGVIGIGPRFTRALELLP